MRRSQAWSYCQWWQRLFIVCWLLKAHETFLDFPQMSLMLQPQSSWPIWKSILHKSSQRCRKPNRIKYWMTIRWRNIEIRRKSFLIYEITADINSANYPGWRPIFYISFLSLHTLSKFYYFIRIGLLYYFMNCLDFVENLTLGLSSLEVLVSFGSFVKREDGIDRDI